MKKIFFTLALFLLIMGCIEEPCYLTVENIADSEETCLQIATEGFSTVCNEVIVDKEMCYSIWDETRVSFDAENNLCYMEIPVECSEVE